MENKEILSFGRVIQDALARGSVSHPSDVAKIVRRTIADSSITFKTVRDPIVENNMVIVGGLYDPNEDEEDAPAITITLHFNPAQKSIQSKDMNVRFISREICATLMHEHCHQRQYRMRKFAAPKAYRSNKAESALRAEEEYLGIPDEIEAYGCAIATDIFLSNQCNIPKGFKTFAAIKKSHEYQMYAKVFGESHQVTVSVKNFAAEYLLQFKKLF